jgi:hypothetical protein
MTDPLVRLLDQATVPAPTAGFADRIAARAVTMPQQTPHILQRRSGRRGGWIRRPRVLASLIGANLLVAGAVAATLSGRLDLPPLRQVPVIAPVLEAIAPAPRPKVVRKVPPAAVPTPPVTVARPSPTPVRQVPPGVERMIARGDALAGAMQAREKAGLPVPPRLKRRVALHSLRKQAVEQWEQGKPVAPDLKREIVREQLELAPPRVRRRIEERVQARREAGLPVAPALDAAIPPRPLDMDLTTGATPDLTVPSRELERGRILTPAERQLLLQRLRARREARLPRMGQ